jgi:signal transduction histidine kinase
LISLDLARQEPMSLITFGRLFFIIACFNCCIGLVLRYLDPAIGSFRGVLAYSESIGLAIFVIHIALGQIPLPGHRVQRMLERTVVAAPLGYWFGSALGDLLVGARPARDAVWGASRSDVVVTVIATACAVYFFWSKDRLREEKSALERAQTLAAEAQLRLLRAQLEPHMLFNTLANLRTLLAIDTQRAQAMIDQLIIYLRSTLQGSRIESRPLNEEFEQLKAYLELMQIRMADRLRFDLSLQESLKTYPVPAMLLQPLVENAIKHGLEPAVAGGHIEISARAVEQGVELFVKDTGLGLAQGTTLEGYGLAHVRERLQTLFSGKASLYLEPVLPHGVCARIILPL